MRRILFYILGLAINIQLLILLRIFDASYSVSYLVGVAFGWGVVGLLIYFECNNWMIRK